MKTKSNLQLAAGIVLLITGFTAIIFNTYYFFKYNTYGTPLDYALSIFLGISLLILGTFYLVLNRKQKIFNIFPYILILGDLIYKIKVSISDSSHPPFYFYIIVLSYLIILIILILSCFVKFNSFKYFAVFVVIYIFGVVIEDSIALFSIIDVLHYIKWMETAMRASIVIILDSFLMLSWLAGACLFLRNEKELNQKRKPSTYWDKSPKQSS